MTSLPNVLLSLLGVLELLTFLSQLLKGDCETTTLAGVYPDVVIVAKFSRAFETVVGQEFDPRGPYDCEGVDKRGA